MSSGALRKGHFLSPPSPLSCLSPPRPSRRSDLAPTAGALAFCGSPVTGLLGGAAGTPHLPEQRHLKQPSSRGRWGDPGCRLGRGTERDPQSSSWVGTEPPLNAQGPARAEIKNHPGSGSGGEGEDPSSGGRPSGVQAGRGSRSILGPRPGEESGLSPAQGGQGQELPRSPGQAGGRGGGEGQGRPSGPRPPDPRGRSRGAGLISDPSRAGEGGGGDPGPTPGGGRGTHCLGSCRAGAPRRWKAPSTKTPFLPRQRR